MEALWHSSRNASIFSIHNLIPNGTTVRPRANTWMFQIDQIQLCFSRMISEMDRNQLEKLSLSVPCPTCGAAPGQKCELNTGRARTAPHRDRRLNAADKESAKTHET